MPKCSAPNLDRNRPNGVHIAQSCKDLLAFKDASHLLPPHNCDHHDNSLSLPTQEPRTGHRDCEAQCESILWTFPFIPAVRGNLDLEYKCALRGIWKLFMIHTSARAGLRAYGAQNRNSWQDPSTPPHLPQAPSESQAADVRCCKDDNKVIVAFEHWSCYIDAKHYCYDESRGSSVL